MSLSFFLRCLETAVGIIGMNMSIAAFKKNAIFRIIISIIILLAGFCIITFLYGNNEVTLVEKLYTPIILIFVGTAIIINSSDTLIVALFNFFTQFIIYQGISMACTILVMQLYVKSDWIYLLLRAIAFTLIIFIEIKFIRKPFQYFAENIVQEWRTYLLLAVVFSFLIVLMCTYPTMYYKRSFYSQMEILIGYILFALVLYVMYHTLHNTVEKYELLQSEKIMCEKVKFMEEYKRLSEIDLLTGLLNRNSFQKQVEHHINAFDQTSALLIMDIDDFKMINDNFGHDVGDSAIKILSSALKTSFRGSDIMGRLGGDEFMVLLADIKNDNNLIHQKIGTFNLNLNKFITESKEVPNFSASIGVTYVNYKDDFEKIYKEADIALYRAKKGGKNFTVFYC